MYLSLHISPCLCVRVMSLTVDGTYSSSGQLTCVACRAPVKSELAWTAHLASRSHRDQVAALKSRQAAEKRPADAAAAAGTKHKRHKGGMLFWVRWMLVAAGSGGTSGLYAHDSVVTVV